MNGAGFGAFMDGMLGGYKAGKSFEGMKNEPKPSAKADGSTQAGYSGDLSKFQATPNGSTGAESAAPSAKDDSWGSLASIFDGAVESSRSIPVLGESPAGSILSGGLGNTIFGKLTGGKGLGGTLLGGLLGK